MIAGFFPPRSHGFGSLHGFEFERSIRGFEVPGLPGFVDRDGLLQRRAGFSIIDNAHGSV